VTDSRGEILARDILGDRLEVTASEIGGEDDQNQVFVLDLPLTASTNE
jgi:hypothetical protein